MDDDVRDELVARAAQGLAVETLLFTLLSELQRSGVLTDAALSRLFDQAEDSLVANATQLGSKAPLNYFPNALQIVEQIRASFGLPKG